MEGLIFGILRYSAHPFSNITFNVVSVLAYIARCRAAETGREAAKGELKSTFPRRFSSPMTGFLAQ